MKLSTILVFLAIFAFVVITDGRQDGRNLHITSLSIQFDKTDATFVAHYDFGSLPKMYLLIFGTKTIEPEIRSIFSNFDYDVIKIDEEQAILRVKKISVLDKGYYLHDSRSIGQTIDTVYVSDPSSTKIKEYYNINSTPNYFYRS